MFQGLVGENIRQAGPQGSEPAKQSDIEVMMRNIGENLSILENKIGILTTRLAPLLVEQPSKALGERPPSPPQSALMTVLSQYNDDLMSKISKVQYLLEAMQI